MELVKKINRIATVLIVISAISFVVCLAAEFRYELVGIRYVEVNSENEAIITELFKKNGFSVNGELDRIGSWQGLGAWKLYICYENGSSDTIGLLSDGEATDLHGYISENGSVGGSQRVIVKNVLMVSMIVLMMSAAVKIICH